eukprot:gnl/Carplike_NY0171/4711_a6409_291.p1 GENE.gnl/Carplike_NY0171/4711_a6409_291~~gnl/Carplike_NY0171/4711_a6409_291.p1  ORF type:complete len:315 (+),score=98.20 gnl/Carplike_NY0171/4711_a6409_291:110-1054(+)
MKIISDSLKRNFLFQHLEEDMRRELAKFMKIEEVEDGEDIVTQGEKGHKFYIIKKGSCDVWKARDDDSLPECVATLPETTLFGELALLMGDARAATVRAKGPVELWVGDGEECRAILIQGQKRQRELYHEFISSVPFMGVLSLEEQNYLCDTLKPLVFAPGEVIIKEGEKGNNFYFVETGRVVVSRKKGPKTIEMGEEEEESEKESEPKSEYIPEGDEMLCFLESREFFGEAALMHEDAVRNATITAQTDCRILSIDKSSFARLIAGHGDLGDKMLHERAKGPIVGVRDVDSGVDEEEKPEKKHKRRSVLCCVM